MICLCGSGPVIVNATVIRLCLLNVQAFPVSIYKVLPCKTGSITYLSCGIDQTFQDHKARNRPEASDTCFPSAQWSKVQSLSNKLQHVTQSKEYMELMFLRLHKRRVYMQLTTIFTSSHVIFLAGLQQYNQPCNRECLRLSE